MAFLCFAPCARYFPRPPQTPLMHHIPPYWANITIIFFRADSDWHCVQRVLRTLLVNFPLLVFPLECRHPRERLALLRVGACAAQLSATRAHSNTAAPGMRRDCPENATHLPRTSARTPRTPPGNANIHPKTQIQILASIPPFKTQNREGKPRRQRICGVARPRERRAPVRARWLAKTKVHFTLRAKREAKLFSVFELVSRAPRSDI